MYKPALRMDSVEPVGSYAIRIHWNDGHSTGIYSFDHLRKICPCPECQALRDKRKTLALAGARMPLEQTEIDFDLSLRCDRNAALAARDEAPLGDGFDRFLI